MFSLRFLVQTLVFQQKDGSGVCQSDTVLFLLEKKTFPSLMSPKPKSGFRIRNFFADPYPGKNHHADPDPGGIREGKEK